MFEWTVCLLLDKRLNERTRIHNEFLEVGVNVTFFLVGDGKTVNKQYDRIDTIPPSRRGYGPWRTRPNSWNAFHSFRQIIGRARDMGHETLLLLEDDVSLIPEVVRVLPEAWKQLQAADQAWEMFYLGANHTYRPTVEVAPNLLRLNGSGCWHAVCLHQRVFQQILDLPAKGPIDGVVGDRIHPRGHSYACWPSIAIPLPGFSHCEGYEVDYRSQFLAKGCT